MNLRWYFARLSRMGPSEIAHRGLERARKSISRGHGGWDRYPAPALRSVFPDWPNRVRHADPAQQSSHQGGGNENPWPASSMPSAFDGPSVSSSDLSFRPQ